VERGKWRYLSDKEVRLLKYTAPSHPSPKGKEKEMSNPQ